MSSIRVCPRCGEQYDSGIAFCAKDGTRLVAVGQSGEDLIGTVVADRYRIVQRLGEGGMGQVFLAEHVRMKRKSAIKIMRNALVGDVEALQRFTREAENASQISHPNVAAIYDFGETSEGLVYLAMEFVDGEPLAEKLQRELAIHPDIAADILGQSADALQAAHDMGILHRDLKPDNIMLGKRPDGTFNVKLVDFGIARTMDRGEQKVTRTGFAVGTPEYMSPEQLSGDKLDHRSDQYSLALVAFVALTGKDAFPAESSKESLIARLTSRPRTLQEAKQDVRWPTALQAIFDKALSPEPEERYESVREFANALSSAISVMSPSQTAAIYRRALEQRLASVAVRTPHSDLSAIRTPPTPQPSALSEHGISEDELVEARATESERELAAVGASASETGVAPKQKRKVHPALLAGAVAGITFVAGLGLWAALSGDGAPAAPAVDTLAAISAPPPTDSTQPVTVALGDTSRAALSGAAAAPLAGKPTAPNSDSARRARADSLRKDSVTRADKARRDSLARRARAAERFPEAAFVAARGVAPNWRERSVRGNDMRVVLYTPQVTSWRSEEIRKWKESHVRTEGGTSYDRIDAIELWSPWKNVVASRRPVVVLQVIAEKAPFEKFEPEKIVDFKRGDVQSVQLMRDGSAVTLLNGERFAAVVNDAQHREDRKAVPGAFAAIIAPDVFAPLPNGQWPKFELVVEDAMNSGRSARLKLTDAMVKRIHDDFAPYRDAIK